MGWLFGGSAKETKTIVSTVTTDDHGNTLIDVRGQTCPGYLLAINLAVDKLATGTRAKLLITYPPCGDDVKAWAKEKGINFLGMQQGEGQWIIDIEK